MLDTEVEGTAVETSRGWLGHFDWIDVRQEVAEEARAEIVLLGLGDAGKSTLFNSLRGWPVIPAAHKLGHLERSIEEPMGLFTLIDLPEVDSPDDDLLLERLQRAALLVYVLDGAVCYPSSELRGTLVRPVDLRWIGRLRATGLPMMVVVSKSDLCPEPPEAVLEAVEERVGMPACTVSAYDPPQAQRRFLDRMVEISPDLAVPLGREVASFRRFVAQRLIRRAALLCGLVSMEPIPLIDLPMQASAQMGLVARLATMHGRPPASAYSKELVFAGAGSVAFRILAQQVAKVVPVVGWLVSGLLGGAATWLMGQATLAYFEGSATPRTIADAVGDLWRERVRPWIQRTVAVYLRLCPITWVVRWVKGRWRQWRKRGD